MVKRVPKGLLVKGNFRDITDVQDELSDNNIYIFASDSTGWTYLMDTNRGEIYYVDDYHFNKMKELLDKGEAVFPLTDLTDEDKEDLFKEFEGESSYFEKITNKEIIKEILEGKNIREILL